MNASPESTPNPMHRAETSFEGTRTVIADDPGLPLDSPEVVERERRRREQLAEREHQRRDAGEDAAS